MTQKKFQNAYILKKRATEHMNEKKYSWAMVYLCDTLKQFDKMIEIIDDADEMQKVIRDIKLPCHKNLSLCYLKQGNYNACIEQCREVLQIQPNSVKILYRLGNAYMNLNNLDEAQKFLKQAFFIDPNQKQVMKALERIQCLRNSRNQQENSVKKISNRITLFTLIKFIFFWPFIIMHFIYRKLVPQKAKTN